MGWNCQFHPYISFIDPPCNSQPLDHIVGRFHSTRNGRTAVCTTPTLLLRLQPFLIPFCWIALHIFDSILLVGPILVVEKLLHQLTGTRTRDTHYKIQTLFEWHKP